MIALLPQKGQGLRAIARHVQLDGFVEAAERFLREPDIAGIILDQKNI